MTGNPDPLIELGGETFVSLTTFRRSGEGVSTPVWVALADDALVVTTSGRSGKVKRIRNDDRVELQACDRRGLVKTDTATVGATAEIVATRRPDRLAERLSSPLAEKYGAQYRLLRVLERLMRLGRASERVILRIRPTAD